MKKIILTLLMLAGMSLAAQPFAAYADDASEETITEQADDGAAADEATSEENAH